MTHDEAVALLPVYALGALDADVASLEAHVRGCARCAALLASYEDTTATLGEAVEQLAPPASLRAAVLTHAPGSVRRQRLVRSLVFAAALLVVVGLAAGNVAQQQQLRAAQSEVALDQLGLALLTSTETTVERMTSVADPNRPEHGHWYHRPGIATEVVVVELMPPLTSGQAYFGWLQHANGSWQPVGRFTLNRQGYGRVILTGGDGADVRGVIVTRQPEETAVPTSDIVLRWSAP